MPYEFLIGWRYLHRPYHSPLVWRLLLLAVVVGVAGLALFLYSPWQASAAILMALGGVAASALLLSQFFSAFTTISILGLAFGVATLVWVLGVTSGFHEEFRRKVLGVNAHIIVLKYGVDFSEYAEVMAKAEAIDGVLAAAPFVFNEKMMARGNSLSGVLVKGVDPRLVGQVLDLPQHIAQPRRIAADELAAFLPTAVAEGGTAPARLPGVIIGEELARKLDAQVEDVVRLISPLATLDTLGWSRGKGEFPRAHDFRVTAIFSSGFAEYDKRLAYVHLREAQSFFDHGDVVTGVELKVRDVFAARALAATVSEQLSGGAYRIVDWSELNRNLFTALQTQKIVLQLVMGFMVVVAAFNVLAALAVLVLRKTREIAILKSMGMSAAGVARVFQSAGVVVWFLGTGLGLLWGIVGALALRFYRFPLDPKVYLISELPVRLNPAELALTAGFSLLVCLAATLYPAARAARLHPVNGLRFK